MSTKGLITEKQLGDITSDKIINASNIEGSSVTEALDILQGSVEKTREVFISADGDDTTGNGTVNSPFATAQRAFEAIFPAGHPEDGPDFDIFVKLHLLKGVDAGELICDTSNIIITGEGELKLTYDVKSETITSWATGSQEYGLNSVLIQGSGYGNNTSSNHSSLSVKMLLSNYNTDTRELMVAVNNAKCQIRTQSRDVVGAWGGPIYIQVLNSAIDWLETGTGIAPRDGAMGITFSRLANVFIRNGIRANNGAVVLPWVSDVYSRRAIEGNIRIGIGTDIFVGWNNVKVNPDYGYNLTSVTPEILKIDPATLDNMVECKAQNHLTLGAISISSDYIYTGATSERPDPAIVGQFYYDTDLSQYVYWDGTSWEVLETGDSSDLMNTDYATLASLETTGVNNLDANQIYSVEEGLFVLLPGAGGSQVFGPSSMYNIVAESTDVDISFTFNKGFNEWVSFIYRVEDTTTGTILVDEFFNNAKLSPVWVNGGASLTSDFGLNLELGHEYSIGIYLSDTWDTLVGVSLATGTLSLYNIIPKGGLTNQVLTKLSDADGDLAWVDPAGGGTEGASAYDIAVSNGFVGTEQEWLASLEGADGIDGTDGKSAYQVWLDLGNTGTEADFIASLEGPAGTPGTDGIDGIDGKSAYQVWLDLGNTGTEADFIASLEGPAGTPGTPGTPGTDGADGSDGASAYQIWLDLGNTGTEADFIASLEGTPGTPGTDGADGSDGASAYQIWLDLGNTGTEADFIASLEGPAGTPGTDGVDGSNGIDGKSAYQVWLDLGNTGTEADFIASLEGPAGTPGTDGADGSDGASAYQVWLDLGNTGTEADFIASLEGSDGVGVPTGGTTGQVLSKASNTDFDLAWLDAAAGAAAAVGNVLIALSPGPMNSKTLIQAPPGWSLKEITDSAGDGSNTRIIFYTPVGKTYFGTVVISGYWRPSVTIPINAPSKLITFRYAYLQEVIVYMEEDATAPILRVEGLNWYNPEFQAADRIPLMVLALTEVDTSGFPALV